MKAATSALTAVILASCARPIRDFHGQAWSAAAIPRAEWHRIEARLRQSCYPRSAQGLLSEFDRTTVESNLASPFIGESCQFVIINSDHGRHWRGVGMILDRNIPADVSSFAAILCGEAADPHHVKIVSIEIHGVLPEQTNTFGNNSTVIFRSL